MRAYSIAALAFAIGFASMPVTGISQTSNDTAKQDTSSKDQTPKSNEQTPKFEVRDFVKEEGEAHYEIDLTKIIVEPKPGTNFGAKFQTRSTANAFKSSMSTDKVKVDVDIQPLGEGFLLDIKPEKKLNEIEELQLKQKLEKSIEDLKQRPDVLDARFSPIIKPNAAVKPNDSNYRYQWHYHIRGSHMAGVASPGGISLPFTWTKTTGKGQVVVAVLDTGLSGKHKDIIGSKNVVPGYDFVSNVVSAGDGDGRDPDATDPGSARKDGECGPKKRARKSSWHGSHVAGTIGVGQSNNGEGIAGVGWNIKVQSVRVLGKCDGSLRDIIDGVRWAAGLEVKVKPGETPIPLNKTPAKIINMSLGAPRFVCSDQLNKVFEEVTAAGSLVVVSAGNSRNPAEQNWPAGCKDVLTVAASDARGYIAHYSSYGKRVDIMAPGGDVTRDDNGDNIPDGVLSYDVDKYVLLNGTSMAAPHVSGVAALILSQNQHLTPFDLKALIKNYAIPRNRIECHRLCGAGLLNANIQVPDKAPTIAISNN